MFTEPRWRQRIAVLLIVSSSSTAVAAGECTHSLAGSHPTMLKFENRTSGSIDVYWIDYKWREVVYKRQLAPGSVWSQRTFLTHPWLIRRAGHCIGVFLPTEEPRTVVITGDAAQGATCRCPGDLLS